MPRKTTGCWTCRARKKKCDDARPTCASCSLRSVTCYGYGVKPEWMDGAGLEKEMLRAFKLQCKAAYRQRRSEKSTLPLFREHRPTQPQLVALAVMPKQWDDRVTIQGQAVGIPDDQYEHHGSDDYSTEPSLNTTEASATTFEGHKSLFTPRPIYSAIQSPSSTVETRFSYSERELNLVMYYLDHIFPRLCPFFQYKPTDNGRGWLLNLFLRTKPLCSLAVCLSACDKAQLVFGALSETPQPHHDLEMQHIQIVADLSEHLTRLPDFNGAYQMSAAVEALACIMHLILFELWIPRKGDIGNDWVMHLDAATVLLDSVARTSEQSLGASSTSPSLEGKSNSDIASHFPMEYLSEGEQAAFQFYLTQYTYCFCITSASLGVTSKSRLQIQRTHAIFHSQQAKIKDMLGCDDYVMNVLLDIAVLREWKQRMQDAGTLSLRELACRAGNIEENLKDRFAFLVSRKSSVESSNEKQQELISNTFINGALVFLHIVTSGLHPNLPEIRQGVLGTLRGLENMRKNSMVNIPSWPYCVAGCMALESEYSRFRALNPPPEEGTHPLVMTKWTLDIIEEVWRVRAMLPEGAECCDWVTAMHNLNSRLLLA